MCSEFGDVVSAEQKKNNGTGDIYVKFTDAPTSTAVALLRRKFKDKLESLEYVSKTYPQHYHPSLLLSVDVLQYSSTKHNHNTLVKHFE